MQRTRLSTNLSAAEKSSMSGLLHRGNFRQRHFMRMRRPTLRAEALRYPRQTRPTALSRADQLDGQLRLFRV